MIRPELRQILRRWSEPLSAIGALLVSLWFLTLGGWFFGLIGLGGGFVSLAWLLAAIRRLPFRRDIGGPGVVEIDEGAIRYYGARLLGGEIALRDLSEIRLLPLQGRPHWRLKSTDAQALLIPLDAAGAAGLADAFAALPGIRMGEISAALNHPDAAVRTLWVRPR
ncbi:hypothetical protein [Paracoccus zhejiangensis]|uniref:Uncharacterized protein n=1 Tax=Paracoccus zhejiangensis TaxID=1077935 RepID=A0A2H5EU78_9RHOB|nr:hypothetical protein [Paracoccus zhejiangensis]AUH62849.1 hypothetical protein CX676_00615 [Paracoccus zhejiangensis]